MAQKKISDYGVGDMVRWQIDSADGIPLAIGTGVILELRSIHIKVYCTKKPGIRWFSTRDVQLIKKA